MTIDELYKRLREAKFEEEFIADPEGVATKLGFDLRQEATSATMKGFTSRWSKINQGTFICFYGEELNLLGLVYLPN